MNRCALLLGAFASVSPPRVETHDKEDEKDDSDDDENEECLASVIRIGEELLFPEDLLRLGRHARVSGHRDFDNLPGLVRDHLAGIRGDHFHIALRDEFPSAEDDWELLAVHVAVERLDASVEPTAVEEREISRRHVVAAFAPNEVSVVLRLDEERVCPLRGVDLHPDMMAVVEPAHEAVGDCWEDNAEEEYREDDRDELRCVGHAAPA